MERPSPLTAAVPPVESLHSSISRQTVQQRLQQLQQLHRAAAAAVHHLSLSHCHALLLLSVINAPFIMQIDSKASFFPNTCKSNNTGRHVHTSSYINTYIYKYIQHIYTCQHCQHSAVAGRCGRRRKHEGKGRRQEGKRGREALRLFSFPSLTVTEEPTRMPSERFRKLDISGIID